MKRPHRLPDFAGVALVDILANGLAMLIIVIVLSIASRAEREERTSEQVKEVETMMSRRFSTSLVLNSLAASPPARLHDYNISPLDQEYDPHLLPIIELHRSFVREFYSGASWSREELLREPNAMDAWLAGFDEERKQRLRADVYDAAQFYLAMSILRDHGIKVRHWHFLPGGLSFAQAGRCPPGVAAKDCKGEADGEVPSALPALASGSGGTDGAEAWPPRGSLGEAGGGASISPFPGGAALGGVGLMGTGNGLAGGMSGIGAGSFPNARPGLGGKSRGLFGANRDGTEQSGGRTRFRLSSPESLRAGREWMWDDTAPSSEQVLTVLLDFVSKLQATLDVGASPSAQLANFERLIHQGLISPPVLEDSARSLVDSLMSALWSVEDAHNERSLRVIALELETRANTTLIVETNRLLRSVAVGRAVPGDTQPLPDTARPVLRLNAHPDVWRGLSLPLERNAILLLPPAQQYPEQLRWRAVAYIAPDFDDFIIGFVYAAINPDRRLLVQAEDNRVRLDGRPLRTPYHEALFGARGWLVALYAGLVLSLLGLLLLVRRLAREHHT